MMKKSKVKSMRLALDFGLWTLDLLCLAFLSGCRGSQSALDPAGPQAGRISSLWWLMFYVCSGVFLLVSIALLSAIFRRRESRGKTGDAPDTSPEPKGERRMTKVVMGAVGMTILILFVFLVGSFRTGRSLYSPSDEQALSIKITGQQWWWDVEYDAEPAS